MFLEVISQHIDELIVLVYLGVTLVLGLYVGRDIKDLKDFSIASRRYSTPIIVATVAATIIGGEATFGLSGQTYKYGIVFLFIFFGYALNKYLTAQFIAPRMGKFAGMISPGDIMGSFYGKRGRIITGVAGVLLSVGFVSAQVTAIGNLFQVLLNIPYAFGIWIGAGIVVIYSTSGGVRAVTITDVLQFAVLIITIPLICNIGLDHIGGYQNLFNSLPSSHLEIPPHDNPVKYIVLLIIFCIPFLEPSLLQRLLMSKNIEQMAISFKITAAISVPFYIVIALIGLIAYTLNPNLHPNEALPFLITTLPEGIKGLAVAGMLAVIMSTADSNLNAASITFVHDIIKPLRKTILSDKMELHLAKVVTAILGVSAILGSIYSQSIVNIILASLSFWGPTILTPLIAGILGYTSTKRHFSFAIFGGISTFVIWEIYDLSNKLGFDSLLPGTIINALILLTPVFITTSRAKFKNYKQSLIETYHLYFQRLVSLFKLSNFNVVQFSENRVKYFGAQYIAYGAFATLNYIVPYFMWTPYTNTLNYDLILFMRIFAGVLCFLLIVKDFWPTKLQKYLPIYWHFTLLYTLPFFTSFMLLDSDTSIYWILNMVLALFLLSLLVDWLSFIITLSFGIGLSFLLHVYTYGSLDLTISDDTIFMAIYMYFYATIIGLIFARKKESSQLEKINTMKLFGSAIAHELRNPIASITMSLDLMKIKASKILDSNQSKEIPEEILTLLQDIPEQIKQISKHALYTIDILLFRLKDRVVSYDVAEYSICDTVHEALSTYAFYETDKSKVHVINPHQHDFLFSGSKLFIIHVLFNLIKNALEYTKSNQHPKVEIWFDEDLDKNLLHFKDNGSGIKPQDQKNIFNHFFSTSKYGSGIGLAFCKMVMKEIGGDIKCTSEYGKYTHFVLEFPKIDSTKN